VEVENTLLGESIRVEADLVVLATGMVPNTVPSRRGAEEPGSEGDGEPGSEGDGKAPSILNLQYRLGEELPLMGNGFPDSHFICFPYETQRTGIYAAGCVRRLQNIAETIEDATGAAMKAIQCIEVTARGEAVHPRAGDRSVPDFRLQRCTQCKRCTEECPFGTLDEDVKGTPMPNPTRCRRCGVCMGACPERIVSFANYSVDLIASMIKAIHVPDEFEEKPRVIAFFCENDAYPSLDMAGFHRLQYSPYVRAIPVRCLGSVNVVWIADALAAGIDGIMLFGCKSGDDYQCHFIKGSELAGRRMTNVQEALERLVLERDRVHIEEIDISEYERIPKVIEEFMETIDSVGPNPYKGF
jgi:quinone-modifying oxidoreductase subunit QmoB